MPDNTGTLFGAIDPKSQSRRGYVLGKLDETVGATKSHGHTLVASDSSALINMLYS